MEQMPCCFSIKIGFAAVLAHFSGNVLKDHRRGIPFKRHSCGAWLGFPLLANDALHGFFLLKPPSHCPGCGSYTVITIFLRCVVSVATTIWRVRLSCHPGIHSLVTGVL